MRGVSFGLLMAVVVAGGCAVERDSKPRRFESSDDVRTFLEAELPEGSDAGEVAETLAGAGFELWERPDDASDSNASDSGESPAEEVITATWTLRDIAWTTTIFTVRVRCRDGVVTSHKVEQRRYGE